MIQDKMDFSMHIIRKLFYFLSCLYLLAGCTGHDYVHQDDVSTGAPAYLQYGGFNMGLYGTSDDTHRMAVLLPTSGSNAEIGKSIRLGIEAAAVRFAPNGLQINFYDTGQGDIIQAIESALSENPEMIIGPVFAGDAKMLRDNKPARIPALSFTSDTTAVGNGVFSMALMPSNGIEAILQEMAENTNKKFIIIAPDNASGHTMAATAKYISDKINLENIGILYYTERDTDSIKNTAINASLYTTRNDASTRAKEILSAIINGEELSTEEKDYITTQLEDINRTDTLGKLPYDSILFLGGADDTKSLVSFLRYYGLDSKDVQFYGTSLWQDTSLSSDVAMIGARFAAMPEIAEDFTMIYESATGKNPSRMTALGYDAMMLAVGGLYSSTNKITYLTNPNGYIGANGLFRLRSNGQNERALQIIKFNGAGKTMVVRPEKNSFMTPLYIIGNTKPEPVAQTEIEIETINAMDYIDIPERFIKKYRRKNYKEPMESDMDGLTSVTVLPATSEDFAITAEDYKPVKLETVSRTYIDSVEITE